ncbi:MAG: DUF4124 domain-containing protein [Marinobacter sp.]|nr:DUF4124 domain-containing protein [Marinobacter sp.]
MKVLGLFLITTLTSLSMTASAEVYRHVDSQGNVTFSDKPSKGAETVEVKPVTTVTLPKMKDVQAGSAPEPKPASNQTDSLYSKVTFTAPENNQAFYSGNGDIAFQVTSSPALQNGHQFEVTLDGQPVGQSADGTFTVRNVFRGTHNAQVNVVDAKGRPVTTGDSITFTVHRPSVLN